MRRPSPRGLLLVIALAAIILPGRDAWGRLAYAAGLPGVAARFFVDPSARGVSLYWAGDYAGADKAFAEAGRVSTYNRGLSLAATGNYALSRAYFDAVLFANPADTEARDNRALVAALVPPVIGEGDGTGRIAALPKALPGGRFSHAERPLDEGRRVADDAWLATLADDPGEFLRLRLADEYKRRVSLGLIPPQEDGDTW
jgi:Ca-activated chloride channel family protein